MRNQSFNENQYRLPYRVYFPLKKSTKRLPLIVFLHGAGERGNDNVKQSVHVVPYLTSDSVQAVFPSIVVAPQCAENDYWAPVKRFEWTFDEKGEIKPSMAKLLRMLRDFRKNESVDTNRIYVIGLSMGGFGTFDMIQRKPEWIAAAVPICGGGDATKIEKYMNVPLWIFHGAKDDVVPPAQSQKIVDLLTSAGHPPRYTEFPEGNHGIWEQSVRYPGLLEWLFAQKIKEGN